MITREYPGLQASPPTLARRGRPIIDRWRFRHCLYFASWWLFPATTCFGSTLCFLTLYPPTFTLLCSVFVQLSTLRSISDIQSVSTILLDIHANGGQRRMCLAIWSMPSYNSICACDTRCYYRILPVIPFALLAVYDRARKSG